MDPADCNKPETSDIMDSASSLDRPDVDLKSENADASISQSCQDPDIEGSDSNSIKKPPDTVSSSDPFAYLDRDFTSEKFKVEIRGLPRFYGFGVMYFLLFALFSQPTFECQLTPVMV